MQLEPAEPAGFMARADHLDLGTFVFTRQPYGPDGADVPLAARPDPDGWRAG
jgi:hypothetical protein